MTKIIYFDICAVIIMLIVIFAMIKKHMSFGFVNRWFYVFAGTVLFTALADVGAVSLDLAGPGHAGLKYIFHTLYLVGRVFVAPNCLAYLFARIFLWQQFGNYKRAIICFYIVVCLVAADILFINPFTHNIFYLDQNDAYHRGEMMILMYVVSLLYAFVGYVLMIAYRKTLGSRKVTYFILVFSISLIATAFQFVFPNIIVECFALAISCLILALGVQNPEERLYGKKALLNINAFSEDMNRIMDLNINSNIVLFTLNNYVAVSDILDYEIISKCIDSLADSFVRIRKHFRMDIDFYYFGDGKYAAVFGYSDKEKTENIAKEINNLFVDDFKIDDYIIHFLANVCVARFPKDINNYKDLIPFVDHLSKLDFTGEIRYAHDVFDKREYEIRRNFEEILDRALSNETLMFHYQPIYSVEKERYIAAEAFLRLYDPVYGDIAPEIIISEAEKCGAVNGITTYLFEQLCRFISGPEFMQLNFKWIEMNLSPVQCMWSDFISVTESLMNAYHVNPVNICFNIVDDENEGTFELIYSKVEELSKLGVNIFLDDFGAGIFEIERIAKLPLDGIKLDRNFVKTGIWEDAVEILENSVVMIKDMGLDVVAVGIEDLTMRRRLVEMGCEKQQGYYYAKPMTKRELIRTTIGLPGVML